MRRVSSITVLLTFLVYLLAQVSVVYSQGKDGSGGDLKHNDVEKGVLGLKAGATLAGVDKVGFAAGRAEHNIPSFATSNAICTGGSEDKESGCVTGDDLATIIMKPGQREKSVHALLPGRGLTDMMQSDAVADQRSELMESKNALLNITWNMVEPAVAAGMHNSMIQAEQGLLNRYMSELAFISQINSKPMMRELVGDPYFECIANRMTDSGNDKNGWVEAMAICMGDKLEKGEGRPFDKVEGDPYKYGDSSDHPTKGDGTGTKSGALRQSAGGGGQNECADYKGKRADEVCKDNKDKKIQCLTDYIFQQEDEKHREELKKQWHKWVGDLVWILSEEPEEGVRKHCFARLLYTKGQSGEGGPRDIWGDFAMHRYKMLLEDVIQEYCIKIGQRRKGGSGFGSGGGWEEAFIADPVFGQGDNFWHEKKDEDFWTYLSVPGFSFSTALGDAFFEFFDRSVEADTPAGITNRCFNHLFASMEPADPSKWGKKGGVKPEEVKDFYKLYWWYAQKIAEADVILNYQRMITFLSQLSSGAYDAADSVIRAEAINQILAVAQTENLNHYYARVVSELNLMREHVFGVRTSEIGDASAVLNNLKRESDSGGAEAFSPLR